MKRLELYGDSILKGVMYVPEQGRYRLCNDGRFSPVEEQGYAVRNHSRMGATIHKGISSLERAERYDEDTLVVLEYGGNDCDYDWQQIANDPNGSFLPHTPEGEFLDGYRRAVELARTYPHVYAAVGWHPENCAPYTEDSLDALRAWAREPKVVAIGEIGLDYYWEQNPPRELQQRVLRDQLALAQELDLPVIVHDREAHADSLAIVQEFPAVRGVFHCFSGSVEMARELLKRGWYLGFDGPVTYKNARKTVEVALECPLDRMLLETDSPYMAPVPVRGTRNDSRSVRYIAEKLAALRGLDTDELIRLTAENGKRLFGIG